VAPLLFGVALGNMVVGIPLGADHNYAGTFFALLNPYALLMGVTTVALFAMHGAIYLLMKTEGAVHDEVRRWVKPAMLAFIVCYVALTFASVLFVPHIGEALRERPWLWALALLSILTMADIPREITKKRDRRAFLASMGTIALMMALFAGGMFPYLVLSNPDAAQSLTTANAASSEKTLAIMLVIALIGMPMVVAYTVSIYWIFRGKVKLSSTSY